MNEYLEKLRADPLRASHRLVSGTADDFREAANELEGRHTESEAAAIQQLASEPRRGGRKGHGDDYYAAVAAVYTKACTDVLDRNAAIRGLRGPVGES